MTPDERRLFTNDASLLEKNNFAISWVKKIDELYGKEYRRRYRDYGTYYQKRERTVKDSIEITKNLIDFLKDEKNKKSSSKEVREKTIDLIEVLRYYNELAYFREYDTYSQDYWKECIDKENDVVRNPFLINIDYVNLASKLMGFEAKKGFLKYMYQYRTWEYAKGQDEYPLNLQDKKSVIRDDGCIIIPLYGKQGLTVNAGNIYQLFRDKKLLIGDSDNIYKSYDLSWINVLEEGWSGYKRKHMEQFFDTMEEVYSDFAPKLYDTIIESAQNKLLVLIKYYKDRYIDKTTDALLVGTATKGNIGPHGTVMGAEPEEWYEEDDEDEENSEDNEIMNGYEYENN